ncbi:DUF3619 family protein [Leptothrix ochracea]|uniref:DUF3619 family protein n=1 Tax=Leptothrix ochracea TaxID=735331 RepID=UPI0034E1BB39
MKTELDVQPKAAPEQAALEARFGYKITAHLGRQDENILPYHVEERLRVARLMAVKKAHEARLHRKAQQPAPSTSIFGYGAAVLGGGPTERSSWWVKLGTFAPLAVLVCGMLLVHEWQYQEQIEAAAEVDAALLGDPLPLSAYTDPGFAEFLKEPQDIVLE